VTFNEALPPSQSLTTLKPHYIIKNKLYTTKQNKWSYTETFWKTNKETKLRIHNITAKAVLKFGSEASVLKKREEQRLEAAQMKFLRHLLGITKLDKEKNQCIRQKNGSTEHSKRNKTVPDKVATTCTEDGHIETTKTSTTI